MNMPVKRAAAAIVLQHFAAALLLVITVSLVQNIFIIRVFEVVSGLAHLFWMEYARCSNLQMPPAFQTVAKRRPRPECILGQFCLRT